MKRLEVWKLINKERAKQNEQSFVFGDNLIALINKIDEQCIKMLDSSDKSKEIILKEIIKLAAICVATLEFNL